jgi:hypothetical protein
MHRNLMWMVGAGLVLSGPVLTSTASRTSPPLENAAWIESVVLTSSDSSLTRDGVDDAVPEPLTASLVGTGYSLDGQVVFPQEGAPNVDVTLGAQHQGGLTLTGSLVGCRIDFQFRVLESATPPVPVTTVPVHIHAQGTADATGDSTLRAASFSRFTLISIALLESWDVSADNVGGGAPPSDSFDNDDQLELAPDEVVSGEIFVDASIGAESPTEGTASTAEATFDPVIEIADMTIPGTTASYRDYFTVEFSPGYFALGQVPVERTTWGQIKRLYRN